MMAEVKIGYCRECFNPDKTVRMNSSTPGESVLEDICASAMYLEQGDTKILIIGMDVRNVYAYFSAAVRPMIREATGVPEENIILHTPHNHSSPDCSAENNPTVIDWRERIGYPAIVKAAVGAVADAKPVTGMAGGETTTAQVSFVRRYQMADGNWYSIANRSKVEKVAHESDADLSLRALRITREGGKDIIMVSYQVHAAGGLGEQKYKVNADFVGPLRDKLEAETGGLVMYMQGACGNTNYSTRIAAEKPLKKDYYGVAEELARASLEALAKAEPMDFSTLKLRTSTLTCVVNHTTDHLVDKATEILDAENDDVRKELSDKYGIAYKYEPGIIIRRAGLPEIEDMPLAAVALGDLVMGFFPFEMFDTNGKQMREASPYKMTFPCGYSLNYMGYMPSCNAVPHGGYEVFMCRYIAGTGEHVVLALLESFQSMKAE